MYGNDDFYFDRRLVERFIKRGEITRAQHNAFLDALNDAQAKAAPITDFREEDSESSAESSGEIAE